jgi:hypothetical protein
MLNLSFRWEILIEDLVNRATNNQSCMTLHFISPGWNGTTAQKEVHSGFKPPSRETLSSRRETESKMLAVVILAFHPVQDDEQHRRANTSGEALV